MPTVLVTGVRGKTGLPLARLLAARPEVEVRGGSSDPSTLTLDASLDDVVPVRFSWDDPDGWPDAVAGLDAVYLVRPDRPDAPALVRSLLGEVAPSVRVVLLSEKDADYVGPDGWAVRVEDAVRESGRTWTILRPGWFMQVLTDSRFYRDEIRAGRLAYPSAGASLAWIDARDIAAVAERAVLGEDHVGEVLELSGPRAVSLPETAALLARGVGRPVEHVDLSEADALAGLDGFARELDAVTFERVRAGVFAVVTDTVEQVTGSSPRTLETFVAEAGPELRDPS